MAGGFNECIRGSVFVADRRVWFTDEMKAFLAVHGFRRRDYFLNAQKVIKNASAPMVPSLLHSSRFLEGLRHPWPSGWQPGLGFRCRPLFYIPVKIGARLHP